MGSKSICVGLLAHVDAGKTTLSEAILYKTGEIRKLGRVDHGDSYLDTDKMERNRGITVFSKQAAFTAGETKVTVLDTPGHVDFSSEMERVLSVIDYALLIISASEGVQSHTETLWRLLEERNIPVIVFINKMDLAVRDRSDIIAELADRFGTGFVDFSNVGDINCDAEKFIDEITLASTSLADIVLADDELSDGDIAAAIGRREVFPCCCGSALKLEGIEELLSCMDKFTIDPGYREEEAFGARIFKVNRDHNDERLTYMRLTGGKLRARETLNGVTSNGEEWQEKVNQIRVYSGMKFETVDEAVAGQVVAVTGLSRTLPGDCLGAAKPEQHTELEPIVMHSVISAVDANGVTPDSQTLLKVFKLLGEEDPKLHVAWDAATGKITLRMMGQVQLEILEQMVKDRWGYSVQFGPARVVYAETISTTVEGAGHFEPLRHYAEVHLILEPAERGSGLTFDSIVSEDILARNWQRLILTHLEEKEHIGVLIGAPITDMKITLVAGRAHDKHTNGGDFREATYRALRQGLMQARAADAAVLLEPYTSFRLEVRDNLVGRIMTELEQLGAEIAGINQLNGTATLDGRAPSAAIMDYMPNFTAITGGQGRISMKQSGYEPSPNAASIIEESGYDPERDLNNPADSVFVSHTESDIVHWSRAMDKMHIHPIINESASGNGIADISRELENQARREAYRRIVATDAELQAIFDRTFKRQDKTMRRSAETKHFVPHPDNNRHKIAPAPINDQAEVILIDGYNLIYADQDLKELSKIDVNSAREALIDRLIQYQGFIQKEVVVVFDAYRRENYSGEEETRWGLRIVYTATDEPADIRIGLMASQYSRKQHIRIVSSDALVQQNALVNNALRVSSSEFLQEIIDVENEIRDLI